MRALAFAAAPILLIALVAGVLLRMDRLELVGLVFNPFLLSSVFVVNIIALLYRVVAVIDAYRVTEWLNAVQAERRRAAGRGANLPRRPLSIAGLARRPPRDGRRPRRRRPLRHARPRRAQQRLHLRRRGRRDRVRGRGAPSRPIRRPTDEPTDAPSASATDQPGAEHRLGRPRVSIPPWDGKERLNILLIGADKQGGGHRTDTLITVSIDPVTKKVAMFSLPRDTVDVPVPAGPGRSLWGSGFRQKINSFYIQNSDRADLWPGKQSVRGYNALKAMLGELYGLDIKYFVEVDFDGFKEVVDAIGGVTVNVQIPVVDDTYPAGAGRNCACTSRAGSST